MTSEEATRRLGVKPETLYAYVSRGVIRSERVPGQRRSRFLAADVERHAARSRIGGRAGGLEVVVETELTLLDPDGRLSYRGWDVVDAVADASFEEVASWLWTGTREATTFDPHEPSLAVARRVLDAAGDLAPVDRWRTARPGGQGVIPVHLDARNPYSRMDLISVGLLTDAAPGAEMLNLRRIQEVQTGAAWQLYQELQELRDRVMALERGRTWQASQ